jgi:AcrR family transcriptional regulator
MTQMVDTVNMPYHHGHLREALVDAAMDLARPDGPEAVVLRAVARQVGVSHNAAYRHFADREALLRATCGRCMRELALLMEARIGAVAPGPDPALVAWASLDACGRAYVEFALTEPGWFRTAFAVHRTFTPVISDEGAGDSGRNPYELLEDRLDALVTAAAVPPERRPGAEYAAWSSVHGLSTLLIDGPLRDLPEAERHLATDRVLEVVAGGLAGHVPVVAGGSPVGVALRSGTVGAGRAAGS